MSSECGSARRALLDRSPVRRLDEHRLSAERHAEQCPRCRSFISESEATAALLKESLNVPPPDSLRERMFEAVAAARTRAPGTRRTPYLAGVVAAAAIGGIVFGYNITSREGSTTTMASIVADHARAASDDRIKSGDVREVEAWLAARVTHAVMVPALAAGRIVGARICDTPQGRGAVIEYEVDGQRVSYFILLAPADGRADDAVQVAGTRGYSVAHWTDRGLMHAFVAALPAARVKEFAHECILQAHSRVTVLLHARNFTIDLT